MGRTAKRKSRWWMWILVLLVIVTLVVEISRLCTRILLVDSITVEAGDALPEAEDYLRSFGGVLDVSYLVYPQINTSVPGDYAVSLKCLGQTVLRKLLVRDTVAPTATTKDITLTTAELPAPEDFLESVTDVTSVTAEFSVAPDLGAETMQAVKILLTDAGGNTATVEAWLTMDLDITAPTITGTHDITIYEGDSVSYRSGVTVTDDRDDAPTLTVETDNVDLSTPGSYTATYIATDSSGNEARQEITITVLEMEEGYASLAEINTYVDNLLSSIITEDMTTIEQAKAVYHYIRGHCVYIGSGEWERGDYRQAGYMMLTRRTGDCYNFFAASKLLLEALGIPNIDVEKVKNYESDSMHYWSLVSVDGGQTYYHFDTTPRTPGLESFLLTDAELDAYSKQNLNCYNRDTSLYPATPETGPEE